jgi:hypothetical protein
VDSVVFNGDESKLYDDVFRGSLHFIDEQSLEFVAHSGQRFVRVIETSQPAEVVEN